MVFPQIGECYVYYDKEKRTNTFIGRCIARKDPESHHLRRGDDSGNATFRIDGSTETTVKDISVYMYVIEVDCDTKKPIPYISEEEKRAFSMEHMEPHYIPQLRPQESLFGKPKKGGKYISKYTHKIYEVEDIKKEKYDGFNDIGWVYYFKMVDGSILKIPAISIKNDDFYPLRDLTEIKKEIEDTDKEIAISEQNLRDSEKEGDHIKSVDVTVGLKSLNKIKEELLEELSLTIEALSKTKSSSGNNSSASSSGGRRRGQRKSRKARKAQTSKKARKGKKQSRRRV